jgi:hypothetical protein
MLSVSVYIWRMDLVEPTLLQTASDPRKSRNAIKAHAYSAAQEMVQVGNVTLRISSNKR